MKTCPTCGRTYPDNTFAFCLEDGALLSAPRDPNETRKIEAKSTTKTPRTEVLGRAATPPPAPLQSTMRSPELPLAVGPVSTIAAPTPGTSPWRAEVNRPPSATNQGAVLLLRLAMVLRGVLAIVASVLAFLLYTYFTFFAFMIALVTFSGVVAMVASLSSYKQFKRGGYFLVDAIAGLVSGAIFLLLMFGSSASAYEIVTILTPIWLIIIGLAQIGAAVHLRTYLRGTGLLAAAGALSLLSGIVIPISKELRLIPFTSILATYAFVFGILLLLLGLILRGKVRTG